MASLNKVIYSNQIKPFGSNGSQGDHKDKHKVLSNHDII